MALQVGGKGTLPNKIEVAKSGCYGDHNYYNFMIANCNLRATLEWIAPE